MFWPDCMSSDYRIAQPASSAELTIMLSYNEKPKRVGYAPRTLPYLHQYASAIGQKAGN